MPHSEYHKAIPTLNVIIFNAPKESKAGEGHLSLLELKIMDGKGHVAPHSTLGIHLHLYSNGLGLPMAENVDKITDTILWK